MRQEIAGDVGGVIVPGLMPYVRAEDQQLLREVLHILHAQVPFERRNSCASQDENGWCRQRRSSIRAGRPGR